MAVSVPPILPRRRRVTYKRPRPRPAAHRAQYTREQLAGIRRRRAFVLTVQAQFRTNLRYLGATVAAAAVVAAGVVFFLGMADDRVRALLAAGGVVLFLAVSLDQIARHFTDPSEETR